MYTYTNSYVCNVADSVAILMVYCMMLSLLQTVIMYSVLSQCDLLCILVLK